MCKREVRGGGERGKWIRCKIVLTYIVRSLIPLTGMQDVMTEEFFLSKVFAESLQPTQVIPYYFRAQGTPPKEDITITTLITANRFKVFDRLVNHYKGKLSLHTIHGPLVIKILFFPKTFYQVLFFFFILH